MFAESADSKPFMYRHMSSTDVKYRETVIIEKSNEEVMSSSHWKEFHIPPAFGTFLPPTQETFGHGQGSVCTAAYACATS